MVMAVKRVPVHSYYWLADSHIPAGPSVFIICSSSQGKLELQWSVPVQSTGFPVVCVCPIPSYSPSQVPGAFPSPGGSILIKTTPSTASSYSPFSTSKLLCTGSLWESGMEEDTKLCLYSVATLPQPWIARLTLKNLH